jgi:hypothetical protein
MAPVFATLFPSVYLSIRDDYSSIPQAPPATPSNTSSSKDGWSPSAIIAIVAAVVLILAMVPLIAIILRRYEKKRCLEMLPKDGTSPRTGSSHSSTREDSSLKSILVTREVQRSSLKMAPGLKRPEEAHTHERGWSHTEVRGGDAR